MYKLAAIASVFGALLTSVAAAPTARAIGNWIHITDLNVHYIENGTTTLAFTVQDEATTSNTPGPCVAAWATRPNVAGQSISCPQGYQVSVDGWTSYNDFRLSLVHSYRDPVVGQPDYVTVWAYADIQEPDEIKCVKGQEQVPQYRCSQPTGTVIKAPVSKTIA